MTYLIDKFDTSNNYSFDNIIIGKKIKLNNNISKYYIYYQDDINDSPKDLLIKIPKTRLIYKLGFSTFKQEQIALYPNYDLLQNFIIFFKEFEQNISKCFISKFPDLQLNSSIIKKDNINFIKLKFDDTLKISSSLNKLLTLKNLNTNSQIELIIKINNIWIKDDKFGLHLSLYQIKYYPSIIELNTNFFDDSKSHQSDILIHEAPIRESLLISNIESPIKTSNKPKNMPPIPSIQALLEAKQKLKAI